MTAPVTVAWVADLWRHPLKSAGGERLERVEVSEHGVPGDRRWALLDHEGRAMAGKTEPRLLEAVARTDGDDVVVTLPTGMEVRGSDPDADDVLSAWLDRPVRLREAAPGAQASYLVQIDGLDEDAPLVEVQGATGSFADSRHPLHLLTVASLRAGRARHPEGQWDARRFRANVVVDTDGVGFVEDDWVGGRLAVGGAVLEVRKRTMRCVIPGRAHVGLERDTGIVRTLAREHGFELGVYCGVLQAGAVAIGDAVTFTRDD